MRKKNQPSVKRFSFHRSSRFSGLFKMGTLSLLLSMGAASPVWGAESVDQEIRLSIQKENATIGQVLDEIEQQTGCSILVRDNDIDISRKVSINQTDADLETVLNTLFAGTDVRCEVSDKTISVYRPVRTPQNGTTTARKRQIKGVVVDASGEAIIGANVLEKGTSNGIITDLEGNFTLEVNSDATLVVSYIGYITQEIQVKNQTSFNIRLKDDSQALEEVVVVGYGTVKKSNLTGAVASVKMDDVPQIGTVNVANVLQGRVSGLSIRQNSAAPDGSVSMVIRGAASSAGNDPLYVIDGFPGGDINAINPSDIESVEVLKDASATAIYGARAANGVILINMKKGKAGTMNVDFRSNVSVQTMSNPYEMMSARDYMNWANDFYREDWLYQNKIAPYGNTNPADVAEGPKFPFTDEQIANARDLTDWFDEITRVGFINEENISIHGGSEKARYLLSLSHYGQDGVVINSGSEKFLGRMNLELDLTDWLTTGVSLSGSQIDLDMTGQSDGPQGYGTVMSAIVFPSYLPVKDEEGNYILNPDHNTVPNPVSWKEVKDRTSTFRVLINNFWRAKLTKDLVFELNWGVNSEFKRHSTFYPKTHLQGKQVNTKADISDTRYNDYLLDATLTYTKKLFGNHQLKAMAGYAYQKYTDAEVYAYNADFLTDAFEEFNLGAGGETTKNVRSSKNISKYLSYFGRLNYDIADKYLFTFTLRADGSDRFGKNNRFGLFPSAAFGWRISEEKFMKQQDVVSNLKLRLSVGQTGNSEIAGNAYGFYDAGRGYAVGNSVQQGVYPVQLANPNLKWETTTEYNVGLDFGFFKNRISGSLEYYYKRISDLLADRTLASYYPVNKVADNLGKTQSQGVELQLSTVNIQRKDFTWMTDLNLYTYRDRWVERNPYSTLAVYERATDPLHVSYGYVSDGLIQPGEVVPWMSDAPAGTIKLKDLNGWLKDDKGNYVLDAQGNRQLSGKPDNVLDDADKVIIKNDAPDFSFGIGNTFCYKGFDLSFFFYGEVGRQLTNSTRDDMLDAGHTKFSDNCTTDGFDRWSSTNPTGKYPSGIFEKYGTGDFWVENADFLRLKNLTLGYTLPKNAFGGIFKKARFYLDAQNLFVLTNYTGSDPETDRDFTAYPNQRTFSFGVELSF